MKVAFWSGFGMDTEGTLHIAAISIILASLYHEEVVLGSNYVSSYMPSDCFFGATLQHRRRKRPYRYCYGEPNYFRNLWDIYKIIWFSITIPIWTFHSSMLQYRSKKAII